MTENTTLLRRLQEQRLRAVHDAREFAERTADGNDLSAEDEAAYTRANADIDRFGGLIQDELKRANEERDLDAAIEAAARRREDEKRNGSTGGKSVAQLMREDLAASRKGETRAGGVYQPIPEWRTFLSTTGTNKGAETVPTTLVTSLYQKVFDDSAILAAGPTILRTESGEPMKLPRLTSLGALNIGGGTQRVAEATGSVAISDPSFDQVSLDAYKYAQATQLSRELVEDGVLDIETLVGSVLGRNLANYIGFDFTLGDGTNKPRGVHTAIQAGNKVAAVVGAGGAPSSTSSAVDVDKAFDVMAKLKPATRKNAKWLCNDSTMFTLRKIKMGSGGFYAWEPNMQGAGMPDRFVGYPILNDPNLSAPTGTADGTCHLIFGDFSAYYVRFVRDVRVEWSLEYAWINDLLTVKAVVRVDGDVIDDAAFAGLSRVAS